MVFHTRQHLGAHAFGVHGIHSDEQYLAHSTVCGGCLKDFRTTARAVQHLKYKGNGCFLKLIGTREFLPPHRQDLPDSLKDAKRLPCLRLHHGPLRPSPGERHRSALLTERYWLHHETQLSMSVLSPAALDIIKVALWQRCDAFLRTHHRPSAALACDYVDDFAAEIFDLFEHFGPGVDIACVLWLEEQCAATLSDTLPLHLQILIDDWASALPLWTARKRLAAIDQALEADLEETPPMPVAVGAPRPRSRDTFPRQFDLLQSWEASRHRRVITCWRTVPRDPTPTFLVFVHLYSGRRRPGDVHTWLEKFLAPQQGSCVILSLDTAVHERLNVWSATLWRFLVSIAEAGHLAALLLGPPCETWTAARHKVLKDTFGTVLRGPRPVRSRTMPWGLPVRGVAELQQVAVGSSLLLRGLHLAVLTALHGGIVLGEHPREVPDDCIPSIWTTAILCTLLSGPTPFSLTHLEQWEFGCKGIKPTTILTAHTDLEFWLSQFRRPWLTKPRFALIGKNAQGAVRTAAAKEYPPLLNCAFAAAMSHNVARVCTADSQDHLLAAAREFEGLRHQFQDSWRADYQPV
eukprot:Skav227043  [mRNA]  locus=scaffold72:533139:534869:- [translate_table: standard]